MLRTHKSNQTEDVMSVQMISSKTRVFNGTRVFMVLKQGQEALVSCSRNDEETRMYLMGLLNVQKVIFC